MSVCAEKLSPRRIVKRKGNSTEHDETNSKARAEIRRWSDQPPSDAPPNETEPLEPPPDEPSDLEFEDLPCTDEDDARWEAFIPDDDQRDPQPDPRDFWCNGVD